jgi:hypothetical protein
VAVWCWDDVESSPPIVSVACALGGPWRTRSGPRSDKGLYTQPGGPGAEVTAAPPAHRQAGESGGGQPGDHQAGESGGKRAGGRVLWNGYQEFTNLRKWEVSEVKTPWKDIRINRVKGNGVFTYRVHASTAEREASRPVSECGLRRLTAWQGFYEPGKPTPPWESGQPASQLVDFLRQYRERRSPLSSPL